MDVIATATGYYGGKLRQAGDEFPLRKKEDFSGRWMEQASPKVEPAGGDEGGKPAKTPKGGKAGKAAAAGGDEGGKPAKTADSAAASGGTSGAPGGASAG